MTHVNTDAPTQTVYPWKAAVRTGLQALTSALIIFALIGPLVAEFVAEQFPGSPVVNWITVGVTFTVALSALVARIMAIPAVNELLTKIGLGATPKA